MKSPLTSDLAHHPGRAGLRPALALGSIIFLLVISLAWPLLNEWLWPGSGNAAQSALLITATPSPFQPSGTPVPVTPTVTLQPESGDPFEAGDSDRLSGTIVLSMVEQGHAQLFWHRLLGLPFTRLTSGAWDDVDPALSPTGDRIAFASNRGGHSDLYVLDLETGITTQLSNDAAYEGHPSWSSDGAWLAYEHYNDQNLEIYIRPIDGSVDPVLISAHAAPDYAPAWRPNSQEIAFVSTRAGVPQIWIVDLEAEGADRFRPLILSEGAQVSPAWSPDGNWLAWSQQADGLWAIYAKNVSDPDAVAQRVGAGTDPQWNPAGTVILAGIAGPNDIYLAAYTLSGGVALASELLPGNLEGATWGTSTLANELPAPINVAALATPQADWVDALDHASWPQFSNSLAPLNDVNAPNEELNAAVLAPFDALRQRAAQLLGWDALSSLANAYVPVDEPLPPARLQDWLYTGRAFELHPTLLSAGWMAVVPEVLDGQTYWRIYLRAAGDLGRPLVQFPWNFSARYSGNENEYQAGGEPFEELPPGYWVDFTALAADYGFERVPALGNWRTYFQGARFNQFVLTAGLSWEAAMLQLYSPAEVATIQAMPAP